MLLDRLEMERRLSSTKNLLNATAFTARDNCIHAPLHVKSNGTSNGNNVPNSLKIIAGVLAKTEKVSDVADALDISAGVVSRAKNGKAGAEVATAVESTSLRIRDIALEKLMDSLGIIDDVTLSQCGAKDASIVARNLAGVVEKLSPQDKGMTGNTLIIYAPRQKEERQFHTIDVEATG